MPVHHPWGATKQHMKVSSHALAKLLSPQICPNLAKVSGADLHDLQAGLGHIVGGVHGRVGGRDDGHQLHGVPLVVSRIPHLQPARYYYNTPVSICLVCVCIGAKYNQAVMSIRDLSEDQRPTPEA